MPRGLAEYRVLTFDCYGTLIDWETGIWDACQPLLMANPGCGGSRTMTLETFAAIENRQEAETPGMPYPEILTRVHRDLAARLVLETTPALDN